MSTTPTRTVMPADRPAVRMRRRTLASLLLVGKGVDAVSTVVGLSVAPDLREAIPLARWLMTTFGTVPGTVLLTLLTVLVVGALAEFGVVVERLLPEVTPPWYAGAVRTSVYVLTACWFAAIGVRNLLLLV